jgi:spore germination cell wall hydrolase CwlJ-like protein
MKSKIDLSIFVLVLAVSSILISFSLFFLFEQEVEAKDIEYVTVNVLKIEEIVEEEKIIAPTQLTRRVVDVAPTMEHLVKQRIELTQKEKDLFAAVVMAEAGGESSECQAAVASVIINRVLSSHFPNTLKEVIYQKNAFSVVFDGALYKREVTKSVFAAVETALVEDTSNGSLFFLNTELAKQQGYSKNVSTMLSKYKFVDLIDNVTFLKIKE